MSLPTLTFQRVELQLRDPWQLARTRKAQVCTVIIVRLQFEDGITGLGEAAPVARYNESCESVESFLNRLDLSGLTLKDPDASLERIASLKGSPAAKCAISTALLDAVGKVRGKPLYTLLDLPFENGRYRTSFTLGIDNETKIRAKTRAAEPFPVLKMKVGTAADKQHFQALRSVAPNKPVRLDANEGWSDKEHALAMIEYFAGMDNIQFVEQPLPATAPIQDWVWLKQRSPLPIFGDESYHTAADAERAAECFDGVNVKLAKTGGVAEALAALRAAKRLGLKTMLGCMIETSVAISAAAHLAELCDYLDLDGNLLITNDPFVGVTADKGVLSFADAPEPYGIRVSPR
ncbi:MAG TPA: dipeptide epimerase [Verrucomicrobia bacterium]|nr:dipeptide epimerase [Verrucomicrobiota bacterium]HOP95950.1 dipeptide epimerase [Verrucomicrobiota bacterium]HPU57434.1 dipeptide epimerase [Verrucomicrobiota bacterium]